MGHSTRRLMMGAAGAGEKTYVDDVFSTYLYKGTEATLNINNGIDLAGEGGMVWIKSRGTSDLQRNVVFDTERGAAKAIFTNATLAEQAVDTSRLSAFNSNGFTLGSAGDVNLLNTPTASWTFREAPGFFDVVTYTGNGSNRNIQHALGAQPGCIMIKRTDTAEDWIVYHDGFYDFQGSNHYYLKLNENVGQQYGGSVWNNTAPTSTNFRIGQSTKVNANGGTYVAYVFGGGSDRTTTTSCSVGFDGSGDALAIPDSDDWNLGQTFTIEAWVNPSLLGSYNTIISQSDGGNNWYMSILSNGKCQFHDFDGGENRESADGAVPLNQWTHIAFVGNSGTGTWYINGTPSGTPASINVAGGSYGVKIGRQGTYSYDFNGKISNLRVVKGTAVYTSAFRPPTKPLSNITNTKLLCCQSSTVTTATVTPGTMTTEGTPSASIVTPFDDPEGFKFGEEGDSEVIKCGVYSGNGQSTGGGPTVELGWQPSYIMIKDASSTQNWLVFDTSRNISNGGGGSESAQVLYPNTSDGDASLERLYLTSTGFEIRTNNAQVNTNNAFYLYVCIRSSDGYVGKLAEAGTDAFAIDAASNASSEIPCFDSNFLVAFALAKWPLQAYNWAASARLMGPKYFETNATGAQASGSDYVWDSSVGWGKGLNVGNQGWMWKRGAGFDVVTYQGNGTSPRAIPHSLGRPPEMIWCKGRNSTYDWKVWHVGLNGGGSTAATYNASLNTDGVQGNNSDIYGGPSGVLPTSVAFTIGGNAQINQNNTYQIAYLFASVDGISKCGYHTGNGVSRTLTCGFAPRFLIIKNITTADHWFVLDTVRGWGSGTDNYLSLNRNNAQGTWDFGAPTSTGFTLPDGNGAYNNNGDKYIWYAHA